jgi:hypothetical protein
VEEASLVVHADQKSAYPVPRFVTGKFCEHLYFNVTNGMDAQILKNPTFCDYPFSTGQISPDGVATFHYSRDEIARAIRGDAERWGWPTSDIDGLVKSRNEAVACWWAKLGDVQASPDTGPYGGRAQRIAARASGQGIMQWTWLPLHRIRKYDAQLWVRSPDLDTLTVTIFGPDGPVCAKQAVQPISTEWQRLSASLEIPAGQPAGKHDHYLAVFGGLTCLDIERTGRVAVSPLLVSQHTLEELRNSVLLFYTGIERESSDILSQQEADTRRGKTQVLDSLHEVKRIGYRVKAALEEGDLDRFGLLLDEHWQVKKQRSSLMSTSDIDRWYALGKQAGALGGKIMGAGGGGFLMFYCPAASRLRLRQAMAGAGLRDMSFQLDREGVKVLMDV